MTWIVAIVVAAAAVVIGQYLALGLVLAAEDRDTMGNAYYGRSVEDRRRYRVRVGRHARLLRPVLRLLGRLSTFDFARSSFVHRDLAGPRGTCSPESFAAADRYVPAPEDVFVATQMKCGTTWMLHVVYEVLMRGDGNLVETGRALHAVCPWLEGRKTVPMTDAPLVGAERPSRVIKTHLPATHCPDAAEARYIYVARHPLSCFASCADFIATNAGVMAPPLEQVEAWFCSDRMWWGPWPAHVDGWWSRSRQSGNVLFVHFEEMKKDLGSVVEQVARFLEIRSLTPDEVARVVEKCGFAYMQRHQEAFEMHPPHLLAVDAELFVKGSADRHRDVPAEVRRRIAAWVARELEGSAYPLARAYPDVGEATSLT